MPKWDKNLILKAFSIAGDKNTKYIILVVTDAYGIGLNNPDIMLVIQWDIPITFNLIIQQMSRVGKKSRASVFILFILK